MKLYKHIILFLFFTCISVFSEVNNISTEKGDKCGILLSLEQRQLILNTLCNELDSNGRCIQQKTYPSPSGKFLIHYDTSGKNTVNLEDLDINGIPDYIDSVAYYFDYAYKVEVDSIGYLSPAPDKGHGGSDAYDVYVFNLGDYHVNTEKTLYGLTEIDFQINTKRKFRCFTSYIMIDNDYSPLDSTSDTTPTFTETGIMGMKITAAHEFHHVIQLNYGITTPSTGSLMEMTSVWMENRLFPESKDYISYLKTLFKNPACPSCPFGNGNDYVGYKYGIFGQYGYLKFGDVILKRMWELIGRDIAGYRALDSAYKEQGTCLVNQWCDFLPWIYYTGSRTKEGQYFPSASEYPEITFFEVKNFSPPSIGNNGYLKPFEFRAYRYLLPSVNNKSDDTLDILVTNIDLKTAIEQEPDDKPFNILCANSQQAGTRKIGDTRYYYGMTANEGFIVDSLFFSSGTVFYQSSPVFPNPFKSSLHDKLYFPVPDGSITGEKVMLKLYKTDMDEVFSKELEITVEQNIKVAILDNNTTNFTNSLTSGVYIFSIEYHGRKEFGKIVIIKE
ncbi:MAG: hypothetical protein M1419_07810 [Bacteroidetes bacterium]|nr:hypothetical protein [Bacteroidota bacterium]